MSNTFSAVDSSSGPPQRVVQLPFADLPRMELEKLLMDVSARERKLLATQGRLLHLLHAGAVVASDLALRSVLQNVVTAAQELVDARYAGLGVLGEHGVLDEFVHVGTGEILDGGSDRFLGVPILIGDRVVGNLYLAGGANGQFSAEDERLTVALAATAGVAIANAQLYQESEQRRRWLTASTEVTQQLFTGQDERPLDVVARVAQQTASADFAFLALVAEPGQLQIQATIGVLTDQMIADLDTTAGRVARSGTPELITSPPDAGGADAPERIGSAVVVPWPAGDRIMGALSVGRLAGRRSFTGTDMNHLVGFAGHVAEKVELDRIHVDQQIQLIIGDDHDRIVTDLNDNVIQRVFAVSLGLQGLIATNQQPAFQSCVKGYIDLLDTAISRIGTAVYGVDITPDRTPSLQDRIMEVVDDHTLALGFPVTTSFDGQLGRAVPSALADEVVHVVGEALTTVAGHGDATRAELRVDIADDLITIEDIDNGTDCRPLTGADAMARHVEPRTGNLKHATTPDGDTHLTWTARIPRQPSSLHP